MKAETANNSLIHKESFFWSPVYLEVSAWIEHIPFAFWIIEVLKPKVIVELGVHTGTSYFSFCQAVKQLDIHTTCYGVDTWKGDEHSGHYEGEVFGKVLDYNTNEYSKFSTLIRSTFDEAKEYFIDGSIDLLHIDGLHTYEAVKHDFETWLPKLSPAAIIIFHDINVREREFGVFRLWEELKQKYPNFQFDFGHGLGIITSGKIGQKELEGLFNETKSEAYYIFLRNLFSERGSFFKSNLYNSIALKRERDNSEKLKAHNAQLVEGHKSLEMEIAKLAEGHKSLEMHNAQLIEGHKSLEMHNAQLIEGHKSLEMHNAQLVEGHKSLEMHNAQLIESHKILENYNSQLIEGHKSLEMHNAQLVAGHKSLEMHNSQLKDSHKSLEMHNSQLIDGHDKLALQNSQLIDGHKTLALQNSKLFESNRALSMHNSQLIESYKTLEKKISQLLKNHDVLKENKEQSDKNYAALQKKNQTEISGLLEKIKGLESSLIDTTNELGNVRKNNERLAKHIDWFTNTYENRSILGTLREKIRRRVKKKIKPVSNPSSGVEKTNNKVNQAGIFNFNIKKNSYYLDPVNNLKFLPHSDVYTAVGKDPFFTVDFKNKGLNAGWYWLSVEMEEIEGELLAPKIYYDYGRGFNEEDTWSLPNANNGKIGSLIKFPFDILKLRFDPTTTECSFRITGFKIKPVSKLRAFQIGISIYKNKQLPPMNNFLIFSELATAFIKTGKRGIKKKLRDSINYNGSKITDIYTKWCALYDTISESQFERIRSFSENLVYQPLFSIIMPVYNAPEEYLKKAIESVEKQAYQNWELCIADDKSTNEAIRNLLKEYQSKDTRIKVVFREINGHISKASNSALGLASGDYMVLLDQDDELTPHSLYLVAKAINQKRDLELIYSDEDKIDEQGNRFDPYFKTDWNKDLFYGQNMINHLGVYKLSLVKKIGGFRPGYEGSQDYDLALRCIEHLKPEQIYHIPHVLYHWRAVKGSTSVTMSNKGYAVDAGLKALRDHFIRTNQKATVEQNIYNSYRVKWNLPDQKPLVSIIIPTKDMLVVLATCISSILQKTEYRNFEILVIDNKSEDPLTLEYFKTIQKENGQVKVLSYNSEFNFSGIVNYGVQQSKGEVILLLNNDTEVINKDWLSEMVSQCMREEIGAVGAKLYYPNGQIQHAGVFLYEGHPGNHIYLKKNKDDPGYFNKLNLVQNYSVVTAACLAVRKQLYIKAGGCDEKNLKVAYNDVDLCLKIREHGYKNLWTPFAQLIHYESLSRGSDLNEENLFRFQKEHGFIMTKWKNAISSDPFFNPNLAIETHTTQLAFPPNIRYEWQEKINIEQEN